MTRSRKWLAALMMALVLTLMSSAALAASQRFAVVTGGKSVNLRSGPSTRTEKLGSYKSGTWMSILGESGDFYRVKGPDGRTGYMHMDYL